MIEIMLLPDKAVDWWVDVLALVLSDRYRYRQ